jgi:hypothetical protein
MGRPGRRHRDQGEIADQVVGDSGGQDDGLLRGSELVFGGTGGSEEGARDDP